MAPTYKRKIKPNQRLMAVDDLESGLPKLTCKQESFVRYLLDGKQPKEAYRLAYDCRRMKETSIAVGSCQLRAEPKIAQTIRYYQRIGLDSAKVSIENHLAELARGREIAYDLGQASAGIQAEHYRGRVSGLYNDKFSLTVGPSDDLLLAQIAGLLGDETAKALENQLNPVIDLTPDSEDLP